MTVLVTAASTDGAILEVAEAIAPVLAQPRRRRIAGRTRLTLPRR